jgi:pantetheine-phosphate adenylyltransferase
MNALYAGSFDPITHGHLWVILRALKLFDKVVIVIADNPDKKYMFDKSVRFCMLWGVLREVVDDHTRVQVIYSADRFLVSIAESLDCKFLVRGIRSVSDFEYERVMRNINYDLSPGIETVFLMPPRNLADISSSTVRGLVGLQGWQDVVFHMVPQNVMSFLEKRHDDNAKADCASQVLGRTGETPEPHS